jgi:hypothetical protein
MKYLPTIVMSLGLTINSLAFAAITTACPQASAFSHVQGQNWQMDVSYQSQGWKLYQPGTDMSNQQYLQPDASAQADLSDQYSSPIISCSYQTSTWGFTVDYEGSGSFTANDLEQFKKLNSNFIQINPVYIECDKTNNTLVSQCKW